MAASIPCVYRCEHAKPAAGRSGRSSGRGGFTLIEIVVVVALIMLLAFLLLTALQSTRKEIMECSNNLRQVSNAMENWGTDNQGALPPYFRKKSLPYDPGNVRTIESIVAFRPDRTSEDGKRREAHNLAVLITEGKYLSKIDNLYCPAAANSIFGYGSNSDKDTPYDQYVPSGVNPDDESGTEGSVRDGDGIEGRNPDETYIGYTYQGRRPYLSSKSQLNSETSVIMDVFYDVGTVFHDKAGDTGWNMAYGGGIVEWRPSLDIYNKLGETPEIGLEYEKMDFYRRHLERNKLELDDNAK